MISEPRRCLSTSATGGWPVRFAQDRGQLVRVARGGFGTDLSLGDGRIPVALPVAWRQGVRVNSQFTNALRVPAHDLEQVGQIAPTQAGRNHGPIGAA